jgi:hypothetical protein
MSVVNATFDDYPAVIEWEIPHLVLPKRRVFFCVDAACERYHTGGLEVMPIRLNERWHYRGKCPDCGTTFSNVYKCQTICAKCGETTFCTPTNRFGVCSSGSKYPGRGPFICFVDANKEPLQDQGERSDPYND